MGGEHFYAEETAWLGNQGSHWEWGDPVLGNHRTAGEFALDVRFFTMCTNFKVKC